MNTLSDRLSEVRQERGWTQGELAKAAGLRSQSIIGMLESGARKSSSHVPAIAEALGVRALWLADGKGPKHDGDEPGAPAIPVEPGNDFVMVRSVRLKVLAGVAGFSVEPLYDDGPLVFFRADYLKQRKLRADRLVAVRVKGDSMFSTFHDGDLVVINIADTTPCDGDVFAVNYEGEAVIKRLRRDGGQWWLSSDNPDKARHADERFDENAIMVGRVVYKQSEYI